jgi:hypothetical protein
VRGGIVTALSRAVAFGPADATTDEARKPWAVDAALAAAPRAALAS